MVSARGFASFGSQTLTSDFRLKFDQRHFGMLFRSGHVGSFWHCIFFGCCSGGISGMKFQSWLRGRVAFRVVYIWVLFWLEWHLGLVKTLALFWFGWHFHNRFSRFDFGSGGISDLDSGTLKSEVFGVLFQISRFQFAASQTFDGSRMICLEVPR